MASIENPGKGLGFKVAGMGHHPFTKINEGIERNGFSRAAKIWAGGGALREVCRERNPKL